MNFAIELLTSRLQPRPRQQNKGLLVVLKKGRMGTMMVSEYIMWQASLSLVDAERWRGAVMGLIQIMERHIKGKH